MHLLLHSRLRSTNCLKCTALGAPNGGKWEGGGIHTRVNTVPSVTLPRPTPGHPIRYYKCLTNCTQFIVLLHGGREKGPQPFISFISPKKYTFWFNSFNQFFVVFLALTNNLVFFCINPFPNGLSPTLRNNSRRKSPFDLGTVSHVKLGPPL